MPKRSPLSDHLSFNAQHSPMGAFMSFTCGNFGTRGGIGLQIGQPGDQEVFIGFKDGDRYSDATLKCLPFYIGRSQSRRRCIPGGAGWPRGAECQARRRAVQGQANSRAPMAGPATNGVPMGLSFSVYSPFGAIPDPAVDSDQRMREGLLPAVVARLDLR